MLNNHYCLIVVFRVKYRVLMAQNAPPVTLSISGSEISASHFDLNNWEQGEFHREGDILAYDVYMLSVKTPNFYLWFQTQNRKHIF